MRIPSITLVLAAVAVAACAPGATGPAATHGSNAVPRGFGGSDATRFVSSVGVPVTGFAIGGDVATAAMDGRACGVAVDQGATTYDIAMSGAVVQDSTDDPRRAPVALARQGSLMRLIPSANPFALVSYLVEGVELARLTSESGFVALVRSADACTLRWFAAEGEVARAPLGACSSASDLAVDPVTGRAYAVIDGLVLGVSPESGAADALAFGDRIAFDDAHGVLYVADGSELTAYDSAGPLWSASLPERIDHLGASRTEVVVASVVGDRTALSRWQPGGELIDALELPFAATDLAVARGGGHLGVAGRAAHAYYELGR